MHHLLYNIEAIILIMFAPLFCSSHILRKNSVVITRKRCSISSKVLILVMVTVTMSIIFSLAFTQRGGILWNDNIAYGQTTEQKDDLASENKVTIHLNSVKFAPLTNSDNNQLKILADYQTNDPALVNTHMDGVMKVYNSNGTLLKTSPIQKGFVLGESGVIQFATSFTDKTIRDVNAEVALTDALHEEKISNMLKTNASLEK